MSAYTNRDMAACGTANCTPSPLCTQAGGDGSATRLPSTPAGRAFMKLLVLDPEAFEELYCATFHLLDCVWLQQGASYMQFNAVMKSVRVLVEGALLGQPHSLQGLCQGLLADWV